MSWCCVCVCVEHHEKLPSTILFRSSNTGKYTYIYNVLWIWLGRQLKYNGSQEICKIEKILLIDSVLLCKLGKGVITELQYLNIFIQLLEHVFCGNIFGSHLSG